MEGSCDPIHITYANVFHFGHLPETLTNIIVVSDIDTPFSIPRMPTQPKKHDYHNHPHTCTPKSSTVKPGPIATPTTPTTPASPDTPLLAYLRIPAAPAD